jgi:hypothetical protein
LNEPDLRIWLRDADAALALQQSPALDAEMCHRVLARRTRTRRAVTLTTVVVGCIAGVTALYTADRDARPMATNARPQMSDDQRVAELLLEADAYARRAAEHKRTVALLREAERLLELEQELAELEARVPGPLPVEVQIQEEINRVATTQLVIAGRLLDEYEDTELAADVYRQVLAEFPDTQWAATARDALSRLAGSM